MFFNLPDFSNMDFANLNGGNNPYTVALAPPAVVPPAPVIPDLPDYIDLGSFGGRIQTRPGGRPAPVTPAPASELAIPPEAQAAVNARRGANEARRGATDQYEADVADFRDIEASEAEQGLASLPDYIDLGSFGGRIQTRPGGRPAPAPVTPAPVTPAPAPAPVIPDYIDMGSFGGNTFSGSTGAITGNPYAELLSATVPVNNPPPPATDPNQYMGMGNNFTFGGPFQPGQYGNQTRPGGPPPPPEVLLPPPTYGNSTFVHPYPDTDYRPVNYYTDERIDNAYQPRSTESGTAPLKRYIAPEEFGRAPIREPMGELRNGGYVNQGISQLPINGQGDTLTQQVFQSGFRPRR